MKQLLLILAITPYLAQASQSAATTAATGVVEQDKQSTSIAKAADRLAEARNHARRLVLAGVQEDVQAHYRDQVLHSGCRGQELEPGIVCGRDCSPTISYELSQAPVNIRCLDDSNVTDMATRHLVYVRAAMAYNEFCHYVKDELVHSKFLADLRRLTSLADQKCILQILKSPLMLQSLWMNVVPAVVKNFEKHCRAPYIVSSLDLLPPLVSIVCDYDDGSQYVSVDEYADVWSSGCLVNVNLSNLNNLRGISKALVKNRVQQLFLKDCALTEIPEEIQSVAGNITTLALCGEKSKNDFSKFPCERLFRLFPKLKQIMLNDSGALITPAFGMAIIQHLKGGSICLSGCTAFPGVFSWLEKQYQSPTQVQITGLPHKVDQKIFNELSRQQELACGLVDTTPATTAAQPTTITAAS
jgi:hypothetical protein